MSEHIPISDNLWLDQLVETDAHRLCEMIGNRDVHDGVLLVPYPYHLSDAISWIKFVSDKRAELGKPTHWSIRVDGELAGGIGLHRKYPNQAHKDEFGYWIGKPYWGKGIMTQVVGRFVEFAFESEGIVRLEAPTFDWNIGSQRVLEKNGFVQEGVLNACYQKNGQYIDAHLYARVHPSVTHPG